MKYLLKAYRLIAMFLMGMGVIFTLICVVLIIALPMAPLAVYKIILVAPTVFIFGWGLQVLLDNVHIDIKPSI